MTLWDQIRFNFGLYWISFWVKSQKRKGEGYEGDFDNKISGLTVGKSLENFKFGLI